MLHLAKGTHHRPLREHLKSVFDSRGIVQYSRLTVSSNVNFVIIAINNCKKVQDFAWTHVSVEPATGNPLHKL